MTISFYVEKQSIIRTDTETPATNSIRYLKAKFEFGDDWNTEHNICPRFRAENEDTVYVPPLINGKYLNEAGTCFVPVELLQNAGRFLVSVIDETNGVCITTAETYVTVVKGSGGMYSPSIQSLDLNYDDKNEILQLTANGVPVGEGAELPTVTVDAELSAASENPVQNKAVFSALSQKADATKYFEYSLAFLGNAFKARIDSNGIFTYSLEFGYWQSDGTWNQMIASPYPKTSGNPQTDVLEILSVPVPKLIGTELSDGAETPTYMWVNLEDLIAQLEIPFRVTIEETINTGGYPSLQYVINIDFSPLIATAHEETAEIANLLTQINGIRIAWEDMPEQVVYEEEGN